MGEGALAHVPETTTDGAVAIVSNSLKQKQEEVALCERVAEVINEIDGSDYYVPGPEWQLAHKEEPVDVVILSKSRMHPARKAQVTTIPFRKQESDLELRDDNGNISKFEARLKNILIERNILGFQVSVTLTRDAALHGVPTPVIDRLADLIPTARREGSWSVHDRDIWKYSEDVASFVSDIHVIPLSTDSLFVDAGCGCFIPEDRRFIEEAVRAKEEKTPRVPSGLMLVIGAASTIVPAHIDSYRANCKSMETPFSEVWIVAFGGQAIAVKRP